MRNQTIYIIGSGAIGKALAVFLKLENKRVVLIRGSVDNVPAKTETFQVELSDKTLLEASVEVSCLSNFSVLEGVVVLANKSFGNANLARALKEKAGNSPLVVLQNGLGVEQSFMDNQLLQIYRCVLFATSQTISQTQLRFKPVSVSPIGLIRGDNTTLSLIIEHLDNPNFHFKAVADIQPILWKKAIANSVFNSVCPLLETDNGIFHRSDSALAIAKRVIGECVIVAQKAGIALSASEVVESLLMISKSSDGQLISTLQDIRNKRKTEIDTLNFSIVTIARGLGIEALVPETKLLGELTKLKSELTQ